MKKHILTAIVLSSLLACQGCMTPRMWRQPNDEPVKQAKASKPASSQQSEDTPAPKSGGMSTGGVIVRCVATPVTFVVDFAVTTLLCVGAVTGYSGTGPIEYVTDKKPFWVWED